jgi:hypothetical protein
MQLDTVIQVCRHASTRVEEFTVSTRTALDSIVQLIHFLVFSKAILELFAHMRGGTRALNMPASESLLPDPGTLCEGKPLRNRGSIHRSQ